MCVYNHINDDAILYDVVVMIGVPYAWPTLNLRWHPADLLCWLGWCLLKWYYSRLMQTVFLSL